jgi:poly(glycerol-phosphate) alpha-glucosyltransferase
MRKTYFLNTTFFYYRSGLDNAQIKRAQLFSDNGEKAYLVTFNLDLMSRSNFDMTGLPKEWYLNMYDDLLGTTSVDGNPAVAADIQVPGEQNRQVQDNGEVVVKLADGERAVLTPREVGAGIYQVTHHNALGQIDWSDGIDGRGVRIYRASYQHINDKRVLVQRALMTATGEIVLRQFLDAAGVITRIEYEDEGGLHLFDSEAELAAYWLDRRFASDKAAGDEPIVIVDRSADVLDYLLDGRESVRKYGFLHNVHLKNQKELFGQLNMNYAYLLKNAPKMDGLLVATRKQAQDLAKRETGTAIRAIPVMTVPDGLPHFDGSLKEPGLVVVVARLHGQKRIPDAIKAVILAHQTNPLLHMEIWGRGAEVEGLLREQIQGAGAEGYIKLMGYATDPTEIWQRAEVFLMTSGYEGFALTLLEAGMNGVPTIAYDVNYGPREIVLNGQTGYLVPEGDVAAVAARLGELFENDSLRRRLGEGAFESMQRYTDATVWAQWQALLEGE